ncbi:bactoprenol glucosyl transferase [Salmonella enterica subsp. enterica serovar Ouakam]|nr:bactoprenol glucosyl transferase [Salmonella enterica subsp. enterica serovar Ouakam]AKQ36715.1 bactoprenol glucosyl transferase [Salmonella enterica subsp. enterica serovar Ouakam]
MKISLVVPVFNEEATIPIFYKTVREFEGLKEHEVEIVFINDGSSDSTESIINALAVSDKLVVPLSFTRNFGKEPALFAGLDNATGEAVIPIDVDLQDPIDVIPKLIDRWLDGADMVLAKRTDRSTDGRLKRKSAEWFYKLHNKISNPKIEENVGDFRLMSREVVENIKLLPERNLFMKGVLSWVGGKIDVVEYSRAERVAGNSKFNDIGVSVSALSLIYAMWMIIDKLMWGNPVPGYPSLMTAILFLGGIQLIGIGIMGEYIGRVYTEVKQRPRYIVKNKKTMME